MERIERRWVVCAFGDIRGFGSWTSRAASSREVKDPFVFSFYQSLQSYVHKHKDVHFKYTGDGFFALKEFSNSDSKNIALFLKTLRCATRKVRKDIRKCAWPQPDGFRIRITCGDVYRLTVVDPNDPKRKRLISEYIEYATNSAAHLLQVNPQVGALATEGVVKVLARYRSTFGVRPLGKPSRYPESVNREDVERLFILKF